MFGNPRTYTTHVRARTVLLPTFAEWRSTIILYTIEYVLLLDIIKYRPFLRSYVCVQLGIYYNIGFAIRVIYCRQVEKKVRYFVRVVYPHDKVENGSFVSANKTQIFIQKRLSTVIMNKCCKTRTNLAQFILGI